MVMAAIRKKIFALALAYVAMTGGVHAEDAPPESDAIKELKEQEALSKQREAALKAEKAAYEAQAARDKVKYGDPVAGKTGQITETGAFGEIAKQRARKLVISMAEKAGSSISTSLSTPSTACEAVLLTSDATIPAKTRRVQTLRKEMANLADALATLEKQLDGHSTSRGMRGPVAGEDEGLRTLGERAGGVKVQAGKFLGLLNTIVGVVGAFRADYEAKAHTVDVAPVWFLPAIARAISGKTVISDVFPSTLSDASVEDEFLALVSTSERIKAKAANIGEKSDERLKEVKRQIDAIAATLSAANVKLHTVDQATGVAPVETLAQISAVGGKKLCTVIVQNSVSAVQLTKETIFGKGGKLYLSFSLQLYWAVFSPSGTSLGSNVATCERVAVLDLRTMTKPSKAGVSLNEQIKPPEAASAEGCEL